MNGLQEIIQINQNAHDRAEEKDRQARGLKPANTQSAISRKAQANRPLRFRANTPFTLDGNTKVYPGGLRVPLGA